MEWHLDGSGVNAGVTSLSAELRPSSRDVSFSFSSGKPWIERLCLIPVRTLSVRLTSNNMPGMRYDGRGRSLPDLRLDAAGRELKCASSGRFALAR